MPNRVNVPYEGMKCLASDSEKKTGFLGPIAVDIVGILTRHIDMKESIKGEIYNCVNCGKFPLLNSCDDGTRFISCCKCMVSSEMFVNKDNPSIAANKTVKDWNEKKCQIE